MSKQHDHAPETITVYGRPAGQGSKKPIRRGHGRMVMLETSQHLTPWRTAVTVAAFEAGVAYREGSVRLDIEVRWPRPSSHYSKRGLRENAPSFPGLIDVDKLARGILDALTGVAYRDDRQVVHLNIKRAWCRDGIPSHAEITISDALIENPFQ